MNKAANRGGPLYVLPMGACRLKATLCCNAPPFRNERANGVAYRNTKQKN